MTGDDNVEMMIAKADQITIARTTPEQRRGAMLAICDLAGDPGTALAPLAALGLIDPYTPLPDDGTGIGPNARNLSATAVHGNATGLDWHRRTRVPLCGQCRAWALRSQDGAR